MNIVNRPEVSTAIALSYWILTVFILVLAVFFFYAAFFTPMGVVGGGVAATVCVFVAFIMLAITLSLYQTRYVLTDRELIIETTKIIGGNKVIPLQTVQSLQETLVPFGIRLFGASFHGGYYYVPSLGRVFLAITNFKDGILVRADHGNFLITPRSPVGFKEEITKRMKSLR